MQNDFNNGRPYFGSCWKRNQGQKTTLLHLIIYATSVDDKCTGNAVMQLAQLAVRVEGLFFLWIRLHYLRNLDEKLYKPLRVVFKQWCINWPRWIKKIVSPYICTPFLCLLEFRKSHVNFFACKLVWVLLFCHFKSTVLCAYFISLLLTALGVNDIGSFF